MLRLYPTHMMRKQMELDGEWIFTTVGDVERTYSLAVPGCWEQHPGLRTYRGKGIYQKDIYIEEDTNLRLVFKGISHTCEIFFDGECVGKHYNAYTPFDIYLMKVQKGIHQLRVHVDNSFCEESALHIPNDYYTYGGIIRPIAYQYLRDVFIERIQFTPEKCGEIWRGHIAVSVRNLSEEDFHGMIKGSFQQGREIYCHEINLKGFERKKIMVSVDFPEVEAWCPENPVLYYLCTQLFDNSGLLDDNIERIGFRTIEARGSRIFLNGKEIFLKGFNRHEDHTIFGCALPLQVLMEDMELILETGANTVRTSHYPNDERFLDLCDERGILVWEENHARGLSLKQMMNPYFDLQCHNCNQEMVWNHYNHPSIIIWGILNECASNTEEGKRKYSEQFQQIRKLDTSRLTAFATCQHFTDLCLSLPDIIGVNLYPLWYDNTSPEEYLQKELQWLKAEMKEEKPIIVSETGAGAVYGYRSDTCVKWTEERQAMILEDVLSKYLKHSELSGVFVWQFCDCRVTEEKWFPMRPKSCNNKGILDGYRRKKLAYEVVKRCFSK